MSLIFFTNDPRRQNCAIMVYIYRRKNGGDKMETADRKNCGFTVRFDACRPTLRAIGDETRRIIIRVLIENCEKDGMRVGEIQKRANISRAAVSHHLKILKEAGIIDFRREARKTSIISTPTAAAL